MSRSTGFSPFKHLSRDEAVSLKEVKRGSARVIAAFQNTHSEKFSKGAIEEVRLEAIEHISKYQAETRKWRDRKVKLKNITPGHLLIRRVANPQIVGNL